MAILRKNKIRLRNNPRIRHLEEVIQDLKEEITELTHTIEKQNTEISTNKKIF